MISSY
jgi:hypothetical protein